MKSCLKRTKKNEKKRKEKNMWQSLRDHPQKNNYC